MLWLQSSISTVAHELWYSPCATIRSSYSMSIPPVAELMSDRRWGELADGLPGVESRWILLTAFSTVLLGSRLSESPNSYGFGAATVSIPVEWSRVSWRPRLLLPSEPSRSRSARYPRKSRLLSVTSNRL